MCAQLSDFFPVSTDKDSGNSSNFRDTLNKYLYHWPLFLISLFIAFVIAFIYLQLASPSYTIKASVIIKDEKIAPDEKDQLSELQLSNASKLAENELGVLKSHNLIAQVVNDLQLQINYSKKKGLRTEDLYKTSPVVFKLLSTAGNLDGKVFKIKIKDNHYFYLLKPDGNVDEFAFNSVLKNNSNIWELEPTATLNSFIGMQITIAVNNINKVVDGYQKAIDADLPDKLAPTISLSLNDQVEQRGKDILNHLITLYNQTTITEKNKMTQKTLDFLDARIGTLTGQLNNSEMQVQGYRSSNGLTDISSQSKVYLENVQSNDSKLNEVNVQLNIIEGIEQYLNSSQDIENASASLGLSYPSLNNLIQTLSGLQSQREKLAATTPEDNPLFDPINRQIKVTKDNIKANIQNIKSSLLAAKSKLQSFNSNFKSSIKDIPVQERQLVDKTRRQTIQENLYIYLLQKREEVSFNYASIVPDARIVDNAYSDSGKSKGAIMVYGMAFLLGLMIPAGFIYGRNQFNNRVTTKKEIEDVIGGPIFSEISWTDSKKLVALDRSRMLIGEEFRALRTNLYFLNEPKKMGWVSLLTSSISNEGKSFVSSNLGLVLAASGKKTIILEMDLRKPQISSIFNLSAAHLGISDYLTNGATIKEITQKSNTHPKLDIIGAGSTTFDPSELLELPEVDILIKQLRLNYDYIILDTPPINLVTDASILSRFSDVTFYVLRQGYTYKSLLSFIKQMHIEQKFNNMKVIFNGVEKGRYGYGYNYGTEYYQDISPKVKEKSGLQIRNFLKRF
jgi:tyrosine-protein kinase Etk/Wzc